MIKKLFNTFKYFSRKISAHKVGAYSAQCAFFLMLSIFPFIILLLSLVRFLPFSHEEILGYTEEIMPSAINSLISDFVKEIRTSSNNAITVISAGTTLWAASKGIYSIIGGLNSVFEERESRHFIKVRFLALFYTLSFIIMILLTFVMLVLGKSIVEWTQNNFPSFYALIFAIIFLRFFIGFCVLVLFFTTIYDTLASGKRKFFNQLPGAIVAAAGWIAYSLLFSFYIDNFSNYTTIYGSLTAVVLLMLWLYSCMYILFFGAEINLYYQRKVLGKQ